MRNAHVTQCLRKKSPWACDTLCGGEKIKFSSVCETDCSDLVESYYFQKITFFFFLFYRFLR